MSYDHMVWTTTCMLTTINYTFLLQPKSKIEECITSICKWMGVNELKLNHDKTEIMMFHS